MDISEPNSSNYGKHWTKEQVNEAFAPSEESVRTVKDWLHSAGVSPEHVSLGEKGWLSMNIPAKQAEALFQTKYYEHHTKDGGLRIGSDEYDQSSRSIPCRSLLTAFTWHHSLCSIE